MNEEKSQSSMEDELVTDYSFLQDASFIELNNCTEVSEDQNHKLKTNNTFLSRASNLIFGTRDVKQVQINTEHNKAFKVFAELDQRRASQILKTKQGLKKTLLVLIALKKEHAELKIVFEQKIKNIEGEIEAINQGISIRDRVKTILNYWELSDIPMSPYSQMILLLAQLKWTSFESLAWKDEDFKNWLKSELIKVCCKKFNCKIQQLIPLEAVILDLRNESKEVQDALMLALPSLNHKIANQTQSLLLGQLNQINLLPVMSIKRLSQELLEGVAV